jgi:RNA polymerase sigma-70 factor, ECF subfamily
MNEEFALPQPRDLANWGDPTDAGQDAALDRGERDFPVVGVRATATGGAITADAYERHASEIYAFVLRIVRDPEAAADLVADTFTKLLVEERAGRTPVQIRAWLYRVAANLAASRGRRIQVAVRRTLQLQHRATIGSAPSAEHAVLDRERDSDLWRALGLLTLEQRTALLLAAQGYDGPAIAVMIGRSHGATRTLMCRARRRLRDALQDEAR